jgi:hypothetical protein
VPTFAVYELLQKILIATLMLGVAHVARAQADPCEPTLLAEAGKRGSVMTVLCGVRLQSHGAAVPSPFSGDITIGLDSNHAIRVLQVDEDAPLALAMPTPPIHAGAEANSIYWGIWSTDDAQYLGNDKVEIAPQPGGSGPYVGGIPAQSLPKGVAEYRLLGEPFIVSSSRAENSPIEPGPISRADLRVDFKTGIATLKFQFSVRGVTGKRSIEFSRRKRPSLEFDAVECENPYFCPRAKLDFYGASGAYAGVLLTLQYDDVMAGPDKVAAQLAKLSGTAAIALEKR